MAGNPRTLFFKCIRLYKSVKLETTSATFFLSLGHQSALGSPTDQYIFHQSLFNRFLLNFLTPRSEVANMHKSDGSGSTERHFSMRLSTECVCTAVLGRFQKERFTVTWPAEDPFSFGQTGQRPSSSSHHDNAKARLRGRNFAKTTPHMYGNLRKLERLVMSKCQKCQNPETKLRRCAFRGFTAEGTESCPHVDQGEPRVETVIGGSVA